MEECKWELVFEFKRWSDMASRRLGAEVFASDDLEEGANGLPKAFNLAL